LDDDEGTFDSFLNTESPSLKVYSDPTEETGRRAITHWRVVERYDGATLVEVKLETGLPNQIRVHFSEAGPPLLGEKKYRDADESSQGTQRIFLHAATLGFVHPATREKMRFESPLPPDLARWKLNLEHGNLDPPRRPEPRSRRPGGRQGR